MKRKQTMPGYYGKNIVRNTQKKFLQERRQARAQKLAAATGKTGMEK